MGENYAGNWKIISASLFSAVLVVGAYTIARDVESPMLAQASSESELLEKIASRDSDSDGLRNWEEALYGTNPNLADTRQLGMTDGEAVAKGLIVPQSFGVSVTASSTAGFAGADLSVTPPAEGTFTATFAKNFFTEYLKAVQASPDGNLSSVDTKKVADTVVNNLLASVVLPPDFKTMQQLRVQGSGPAALKDFAAAADAVFMANRTTATTSELVYLQSLLEEDNATAIPYLSSIGKTYRDIAAGLAVLPVPQELAADHLAMLNAMARIGKLTEDFTQANTDPLLTMLALRQYPSAAQAMGTAFIRINQKYLSAGVTLQSGEAGVAYVNLIRAVVEEQKKSVLPSP